MCGCRGLNPYFTCPSNIKTFNNFSKFVEIHLVEIIISWSYLIIYKFISLRDLHHRYELCSPNNNLIKSYFDLALVIKIYKMQSYGFQRHLGQNCLKDFCIITWLSIYKFGLSVCLFVCLSVCLYPINVKTAEPIGPKFFVGHHVTTGKVYDEWSKFQIFVSIKIRSSLNFWKFWKSTKFFVKIRELFLFCFTMYPKRTCSQLI